MPMMFLAAMMTAQAPAAIQPGQPAQAVAATPKPKQVCEYEEIVGSHAKKRVCHNANDTQSDSADSAIGNAKLETIATAGSGTLGSH